MTPKPPTNPFAGKPTVQDVAIRNRLAKIHRAAALDVRDTIQRGRYLIAIFPIDKDGSLSPEPGLHSADLPFAVIPEIVALFKERMQEKLASRRNVEDDTKGPLELLDSVVAEHTPAEEAEPKEADNEQPDDPAE